MMFFIGCIIGFIIVMFATLLLEEFYGGGVGLTFLALIIFALMAITVFI
jgi:hypothetical protein